ncbi:MAG TPA: membrane protein insertion efficiency factor YidD [Ruminococcaceae bacterium]|nr:membrane protein insertion efficiency factor YidD [Oscillospiraceae bacterium]
MSKFLVWIIKIYQKGVSPRKISCCRFTPTCSAYAVEALEKHGLFVGLPLVIWRVLRCNPWCKGGYDPVPEKRPFRKVEK